jgi:hypothetical protein
MKNIFIIIGLVAALNSFARMDETFRKCDASDLRLLETAHSRYGSVMDVVRAELLAKSESCMVSKPRRIYPAVCGIHIEMVDTYKFMTDRSARFEVVVDHSYIACQRTRALRIPTIQSLKFVDLPILPNS